MRGLGRKRGHETGSVYEAIGVPWPRWALGHRAMGAVRAGGRLDVLKPLPRPPALSAC